MVLARRYECKFGLALTAPGPALHDKGMDAQDVVKAMQGHLSQFKQMSHNAVARIERLAELSMVIEDELKRKEFADRVTELFVLSNKFEEKLSALIDDYEIEKNRIENEEV